MAAEEKTEDLLGMDLKEIEKKTVNKLIVSSLPHFKSH